LFKDSLGVGGDGGLHLGSPSLHLREGCTAAAIDVRD
jgi:hypothetical protein